MSLCQLGEGVVIQSISLCPWVNFTVAWKAFSECFQAIKSGSIFVLSTRFSL